MDIADWLRRLGLDQYERAFRDNDVDTETLPSLTADDLRELGVTSLGHRKKLLSAIATLSPKPDRDVSGEPPVPEVSASPAAMKTGRAERRHLTVMFADLVGFTTLSESRDSEDVRELLTRYFETCSRLIQLYGGTVEKFIATGT